MKLLIPLYQNNILNKPYLSHKYTDWRSLIQRNFTQLIRGKLANYVGDKRYYYYATSAAAGNRERRAIFGLGSCVLTRIPIYQQNVMMMTV